jgi:glycosyltransferase involved in cell wall biosynthesis
VSTIIPYRVLLVSGEWPPERGGIATHIHMLERYLPQMGWTTYRFDLSPYFGKGWPLRAAAQLRLQAAGADIVHAHDLVVGQILGAFATRTPAVSTLHSSSQRAWVQSRSLSARISRRASRSLQARIGVSPDTADLTTDIGSINVIPNGVEPPAFQDRFMEPGNGRLLFARRLVEKNGLGLLLRAIKLLGPNRPPLDVTALGSKNQVAEAVRMTKELGLEGAVTFIHPFPAGRWATAMAPYSAVVVPSDWDAVAYGILEPLSCGRIVVLTDFPAGSYIAEHLPRQMRFLAGRGDAEGLARVVRDALDADCRTETDTRASLRNVATAFSAERMVASTTELYLKVLASGKVTR